MFVKMVNTIRCCPYLHILNRKKDKYEYRKINRKYTYGGNKS